MKNYLHSGFVKPTQYSLLKQRSQLMAEQLNMLSDQSGIHAAHTLSPSSDPYNIRQSPTGFQFLPGGIEETRR